MRYENPLYMAEDAGAADLIAGGRLQLGISRGSPEQVIDGWRHFGYAPPEGRADADMARRHAEVFLEVLRARASPSPTRGRCSPIRPGCCASSRTRKGLRDRIWWGSSSNATARMGGEVGMNLQSSTLKNDESGEPLHVQQAEQIEAVRAAWKEAGHAREPRVSVSRSIFALVDDRDRAYFGRDARDRDQVGYHRRDTRAIFGRSYAAEPDVLVKELAAGRSHRRRRHAAPDRAEPARRRLQRPRHREHPQVRRAGARLALTSWVESVAQPKPPIIVIIGASVHLRRSLGHVAIELERFDFNMRQLKHRNANKSGSIQMLRRSQHDISNKHHHSGYINPQSNPGCYPRFSCSHFRQGLEARRRESDLPWGGDAAVSMFLAPFWAGAAHIVLFGLIGSRINGDQYTQ